MPSNNQLTLFEKTKIIAGFIAVLWIVYGVSALVPSLNDWGLVPRSIYGLPGIVTMVFLHGSFGHLLANTAPLFLLLLLLCGSRNDPIRIVSAIQIASGGLLWLIGREANHIGASVLIYGLITFLLLSGFIEARPLDIVISVGVLLYFGGTLFWGILPTGPSHISWEGHLSGAVMGGAMAWWNRKTIASPEPS